MINRRKQIIWGLILIFLLSPSLVFAELSKINNSSKDFTLFLNSGITHCETATVKYTLWTDDSSELEVISKITQNSPLVWQKEVVSDFTGKKIYKYFSINRVDRKGEKLIFSQLESIERQIKGTGILLYFYQQVDEIIDIWDYLNLNKLRDKQKTQTDQLLSINGYSDIIGGIVQSSPFNTNVQIITNNQNKKGKSLIAIPALLDEF
ncbi:MAG: hypothetical protein APF84_04990 [Gracilibacter sp. BRH_c7a]|nr:MAG: hypothetical protein APF84_04990 [Gracilibacter sp. BRH_c7a]